jgi:hypothetical protein
MGADFVEQVRDKYKNMESGFGGASDFNLSNNSKTSSGSSFLGSSSGFSGPTYRSSGENSSFHSNKRTAKRPVSPRTLNSRLDCFMVRKIVDTSLISREAIKQAIELKLSTQASQSGPSVQQQTYFYGDDFRTPVEMAKWAYDLDRKRAVKAELFRMLGDLVIAGLPQQLSVESVRQFMVIKYGVWPASLRLVHRKNIFIKYQTFV